MAQAAIVGSRTHQWGGIALALGNLLFLLNKVNEMSRLFLGRIMPDLISGQNPPLIFVGQVLLIIGFVAYYQFYAQRVERAGKIALGLLSGGGILLAFGHFTFMTTLANSLSPSLQPYFEYLFIFVAVGLLLLLIGLFWFGFLSLRKPILSQWRWLPLATGVMGFCGFILASGEEITAIFLVFRTLFALGLIGLGLMLWREEPIAPQLLIDEAR